MKNFDKIFPLLIESEGTTYTNDPDDNGGATRFGITQRETSIDVRTMTLDQAKAIYKKKYWDALDCDNLPSGVDYTVFDYGVNSGLGRPRKALDAFKSKSGTDLINAINDERTAFLTTISNPNNKKYAHNFKYRNGWLKRVARVRQTSLDLAKNKDNLSGPATATITAAGTSWTFKDYIMAHPYLSIAGVLIGAALIGWAVHYFRNKNA